jgi:hypothetical protein
MASTQRLAFLDPLRVIALGLLLVYHVGMYYVRWDWHVKSTEVLPGLEPWMRALNPWRMSLLFLVSGAVTALVSGPAGGSWLGARLRRLGWPLLAGVALVVPPQSWWQVREQFGYTGGFTDFMGLYWRGGHGFCDGTGRCLVLPTWNHLWFLPYLMVYTALAWGLWRRWPGLPQAAGRWLAARLGPASVLWAPMAVLVLLRLALRPWFDLTHDLVHDPLAHAQYLPAFALGAWWAHTPGAWAAVERCRWTALVVATAAWLLLVWGDVALPPPLARTAFAAQQWAGVVAAVGFAHRHLGRPGPWWHWCSRRVFPVYVLHQTLLIGLAMALRPLAWPAALEAPTLLLLTLALSLAGAALALRLRWLSPWLGGPAR